VTVNTVSAEDVRAFSALFAGREDLYASAEAVRPIRQPVTEVVWRAHLEGSFPIGVFPMMPGDLTRWLCVDVDAPKDPEQKRFEKTRKLVAAFDNLGARAYAERSKGKGYHVWTFFPEPVPASKARYFAMAALAKAQLPLETEIFPRQDTLSGIEVGNWVRLPFAGHQVAFDTGKRVMVAMEDGSSVSLNRFLNSVAFTRLEECTFDNGASPKEEPVFTAREGADDLLSRDVPEGGRHQAAVRVVGLLARQHARIETVTELARQWNLVRCKPPLPDEEIEKLVRYATGKQEKNGSKPETEPQPGPALTRIANVTREAVLWRWQDRLPRGKLTLISGDPGEGKSWLTMALATPITRGLPLFGDSGEFKPGNVLLLNAEDGAGDTIRPRLEDLGADLERVVRFSFVRDKDGVLQWIDLKAHMRVIEAVLADGDYELVIIDPINAYLGNLDAHKDTAIRGVLGPLAALAERFNVAIVVLRHLTKAPAGKAIYRGIGSIGYTGAARVEWLVGRHPDNQDERVVVTVKNNLAPLARPLAFSLGGGEFRWVGEVEVTADDLLKPDASDRRSALTEALDFLCQSLADGERLSDDIKDEAEASGISERTLRRAFKEAGVQWRREGFGRGARFFWRLP
jgi:hypothetical protein